MKKKILSIILALCVALSVCAMPVYADEVAVISQVEATNVITITVDGNAVDCNTYGQLPVIVEGRTLVPLRAVFEALGATVEWNGDTRTVASNKGDITISLQVDSAALVVNGETKTIDVPAQIMNDRTMVPVRAVAEAFGCKVEWNGNTRTVAITTVADNSAVTSDSENIENAKKAIAELWGYTQAGDFVNVARYYPADSIYTQAQSTKDIVSLGLDMGSSLEGIALTEEQRERMDEASAKFATAFLRGSKYEITSAYMRGEQVVVEFDMSIPNIATLDIYDYITEEEILEMFINIFTKTGYSAIKMYTMSEAEMEPLNIELTVQMYEVLFERVVKNMPNMGVITMPSSITFEMIDGTWKVVEENGEPYIKLTDAVK